MFKINTFIFSSPKEKKKKKKKNNLDETGERRKNSENLFEIKEIMVKETFSCSYSPGCDCCAY